MTYQITASIVLYKNNNSVKQAITSFLNSTVSKKLFLVDNSPSDILKTQLKEFIKCDNVEYVFNNKNLGYGAAHNIALKKAIDISEFHLVLNPDVYFNSDIIEQLYNYALANSNTGLLMPKVLYPSGKLQYTCKLIPSPLHLVTRLLPSGFFKTYRQRFELRFTGYNSIMDVPYVQGSFMFLRCSALKEVGLFDERFFMYPEDIDLTRRIHKKYRTVFYPYVEIFHTHTKSSFKNFRMFFIHTRNIIKYFNKWGWLFDEERKTINKTILQQLKYNAE